MFLLHVLKRKSRTKVGCWVCSSRYSWLCLIKYSADIRHWQLTWFSGNVFRIHSVHPKLKAFLDQLQMNECRSEFLFWLNYCFWSMWSILDEFWKIMKIWLWTIEVHSNYAKQWGPLRVCWSIFIYSDRVTWGDKSHTESDSRTLGRGSSESSRRALLVICLKVIQCNVFSRRKTVS